MCFNKKYQYLIALAAALISLIHFYRLDSECFISYMPMSMIILILPWIWGTYIYDSLTHGVKNPISFRTFQCIMTTALSLLLVFFIVIVYTGYVPSGYLKGVC